MAGNPFRKSQFLSLDIPAREADDDPLATATSTSTNTQPKTKGKVHKKVRILSPVVSPDSPAAYQGHDPFDSSLNPVGHAESQDKDIDVARELRESFIDSLARGATRPNPEAAGAAVPVAPPIASSPALAPENMANPMQPGQHAPYNPFARTLATIDPQNASSAPVGLSRDSSTPSAKPAMDVDAFTRMLLTGNGPAASLGPTTPSSRHGSAANNSLGLGDLHPESPSASDDEHHNDPPEPDYEGLTGLVKPPEAQSKRPKPPPPAHHHGKALPSLRKGPQTVSFADFDVPSTPPALPSPQIASPKPELVRSPSDLNKPLPPPPPPHQSPSPDSPPPALDQPDVPAHSPQLAPENFTLQSRKAPPPPISRRSSQMRAPSGRPRSSSNLSRSSVPDDHSESTVTPPSKPPPPPARRVPHSVETDLPIPSARPPPPPPARNTKQRPPEVSRTPSTNSVASLNNRHPSSNPAQMPPPPPPRRGENKRRSLDGTMLGPAAPSSRRMSDTSRRSSGASFHSVGGRTPSVSSIPTVDEGDSGDDRSFNATPQPGITLDTSSAGAGSNDILADMSAMQAEIDALMARSKGGS